jgi:hypothetical protein
MRKLIYAGMLGILAFASGCGETATTVTGNVTYNGAVVENGTISFRPSDGMGQSFAATIENGVYTIPAATPGMRKVEIHGLRKVQHGVSHEDAARLADQAMKDGKALHVSAPTDYIPIDAEGNQKEVEIVAGDQSINFDLKGPPRVD